MAEVEIIASTNQVLLATARLFLLVRGATLDVQQTGVLLLLFSPLENH